VNPKDRDVEGKFMPSHLASKQPKPKDRHLEANHNVRASISKEITTATPGV